MARIGDLVGIDADEAALDPRVEAVEILALPFGSAASEGLAQQRRHEIVKRARAANLHLDQERLAFVDSHAARLADGLAPPSLRQPALIKRVAGFVQHAHERAAKISFVIAR